MLILSLFAAIIVLCIKTGMLFGSSWLNMRQISCWAAFFGSSIIVLSSVFYGKYYLFVEYIDKYTFAFACIAGLFFIYLGLDQHEDKEIVCKKQKVSYWLGFLPCPFCVGALVVSVIYTAARLKVSLFVIAIFTSIVFSCGIIAVSWTLRKFLKRYNVSLTEFFHQFLLIVGVFCLLSAFLIPNIVAAMQDTFMPMVLSSKKELILSLIIFFILLILGIGKELLINLKRTNN